MTARRDELLRRVGARARHDLAASRRGIDSSLADFDRRDSIVDSLGWDAITGTALDSCVTSTTW